jgi:hypothetical protein
MSDFIPPLVLETTAKFFMNALRQIPDLGVAWVLVVGDMAYHKHIRDGLLRLNLEETLLDERGTKV